MLPELSGEEVCRAIRAGSDVPILMLTARAGESDKVAGLGLGADDYMTKPFGIREFMARVEALLRRSERVPQPQSDGERLQVAGFILDASSRRATLDQREVKMSPREFSLLFFMLGNPGRVHSREALLRAVWGLTFMATARPSPCTSDG